MASSNCRQTAPIAIIKAHLSPMQEESVIMDSSPSLSSIKLLTRIWAEAIEAYANQERLLFIVNSQSEEAIRLFAEYYSICPLIVKKPTAKCTSRKKIINRGAVLIPIFKYDAMVHQIQQYHVNKVSRYNGLIKTYQFNRVIQEVTDLIVEFILPSLSFRGIFECDYVTKIKKQINSPKQQSFRHALCGYWRKRNLRQTSSESLVVADNNSGCNGDIENLISMGVLAEFGNGEEDPFVDLNGIIAVTPPFFTQITNRLIHALRAHRIRAAGKNGANSKLSVIDAVEWAFVEYNLQSSITSSFPNAHQDLVLPILVGCTQKDTTQIDVYSDTKCNAVTPADDSNRPIFDCHNRNGSQKHEEKCLPATSVDSASNQSAEDKKGSQLPEGKSCSVKTSDDSASKLIAVMEHEGEVNLVAGHTPCSRPVYSGLNNNESVVSEQKVASPAELCSGSTHSVIVDAVKKACETDYLDVVLGITSRNNNSISVFQPAIVRIEFVKVPIDNTGVLHSMTMALTNVVSPEFQDMVFNDGNRNLFIDSSAFSGIAEGRRFTRVASANGTQFLNIKSSKNLIPTTAMSETECLLNNLLTKIMHIAENAAVAHLKNRLVRRFDGNCLLTNVAVATASCYDRHCDTAVLNFEDCYKCTNVDHVAAIVLPKIHDSDGHASRFPADTHALETNDHTICECGNISTRVTALPSSFEMCVPTFTGVPDVAHSELLSHVATLNVYGPVMSKRSPEKLKLYANTVHLQLWGSQLGSHQVEWCKQTSGTVRVVSSARRLLCPSCDPNKFTFAKQSNQLVQPSVSQIHRDFYNHSLVVECLRQGKQPRAHFESTTMPYQSAGDDTLNKNLRESNQLVSERSFEADRIRYDVNHLSVAECERIPFPTEYIASHGKSKLQFLSEMTGICELHERKLAVVVTNHGRQQDATPKKRVKNSRCNGAIQQTIIGHTPVMSCFRCYNVSTRTEDNQPLPQMESRRLITGDLVPLAVLLSALGISGSQARQKHTWGEEIVTPVGTKAILLYAIYKNDFTAIVRLQDQIADHNEMSLKDKVVHTPSYDRPSSVTRIDIYGSGGNAMANGNYATESYKLDARKPSATVQSPIHQTLLDTGGKKNLYLSEASLNKYAIMIFAPCKEDLRDQAKRKTPSLMQYLGQFYVEQSVHGLQDSESDIEMYRHTLESMIGPMSPEERTNLSFRSEPHIKATVRRLKDPTAIDDDEYTFVYADQSTLSEHVEIPLPDGFKKGQAFRDGSNGLSSTVVRRLMLLSVIDEISGHSYDTEDEVGREHERMSFCPPDFATVMQHMFIGCSVRALDDTVQVNNGVSTILHGGIEYGSCLADFVRAFPMPSPVRTYDKITSYLLLMARNSVKPLSLSDGKVLDRRLVESKDLSNLITTAILLRLTGRVDMWHEYQLSRRISTKTRNESSDLLDDSLLCDEGSINEFFLYVQSTLKKGNPDCSISHWISDQFTGSLPTAVKASYSRFRQFSLGAVARVPGLVVQLIALMDIQEPTRSEAVSLVDGILSANWGGERRPATGRNRLFFAHMIISDIEEVYSTPFGDPHETHYGYGGMQGFRMMNPIIIQGTGTDTPTTDDEMMPPPCKKQRNSPTTGDTLDSDTIMQFLTFLRGLSCGELAMVGLKKKRAANGGQEKLVVSYNERTVGFIDMEHMACKLHIAVSRTRGTRAYSMPTSIPRCCYPCRFGPLYPLSMRVHFLDAVGTHIECCLANSWRPVPPALQMAKSVSDIAQNSGNTYPRQPHGTIPPSRTTASTSEAIVDNHDGNGGDHDNDFGNHAQENDDQSSAVIHHPAAIDTKTSSPVLLLLREISRILQQRTRNSIIDTGMSQTQFWSDVSLQLGTPHPKDDLEQVFGIFDQPGSILDDGTVTERFLIAHPLFASERHKDLMRRLGIVSGYATTEPTPDSYMEEVRQSLFPKPKNTKHHAGFSTVSNGGDNIRYRRMENWDSMGKENIDLLLRPVVSKMKEDTSLLWTEKGGKPVMPEDVLFRASCILSEMNVTSRSSDSNPQSPHCDYDRKSQEGGTSTNCPKPISVFCPLSKDGMMLQVWTDDLETAVLVYVPYGTLLYMDGDVFHAGGFCFGSGCNERLHFYVVSSEDKYTFGMIEDGNIYTPRKMKHIVNKKLSDGVCPVQMEKVKKTLLWNTS